MLLDLTNVTVYFRAGEASPYPICRRYKTLKVSESVVESNPLKYSDLCLKVAYFSSTTTKGVQHDYLSCRSLCCSISQINPKQNQLSVLIIMFVACNIVRFFILCTACNSHHTEPKTRLENLFENYATFKTCSSLLQATA